MTISSPSPEKPRGVPLVQSAAHGAGCVPIMQLGNPIPDIGDRLLALHHGRTNLSIPDIATGGQLLAPAADSERLKAVVRSCKLVALFQSLAVKNDGQQNSDDSENYFSACTEGGHARPCAVCHEESFDIGSSLQERRYYDGLWMVLVRYAAV